VTEPTLDSADVLGEFRKPDGSLVYLQKDNHEVYERKGYTQTGRTMSRSAWNVYAADIERFRGIGDDQSASADNTPKFPGPLVT
jgi:hypothetical protein